MRLLVIDDDPGICSALQIGLEAAGYGCDVATDGEEGLWRLREYGYDMVLLDVGLPGIDGFEVCRRMRAEGIDVLTLMLTSRSAARDEVLGLDRGADDYLTKPFSLPVLLARVRALARRRAPVLSDRLQAGDLVYDPRSRRCRRGEVDIELTERESQVLEALMRRRGSWVPKRRILELVWGPDEDVGPNLVEVHVSALRRKVDKPFDVPVLEAKRGHGYRVVDGRAVDGPGQ